MNLILIFFLTVTPGMIYHQLSTRNPFTAPAPTDQSINVLPLKIIGLAGSVDKNKILLKWTASDNQEAGQFEIERSADGKDFKMAALVFGTDRPDTDDYQFFERTNEISVTYRIKAIGKNGTSTYSDTITIRPELILYN
jgi:hypothetical protein